MLNPNQQNIIVLNLTYLLMLLSPNLSLTCVHLMDRTIPAGSADRTTTNWYLDGNDNPVCKTGKKTQLCITDFWTQSEREREG